MSLETIPINCHRSLFKKIEDGYDFTLIHYEGQSLRKTSSPPYIEVRMDGPWLLPTGGGEVYVQFEANILIVTGIQKGLYDSDVIGGKIIALLYNSLDINDENGVFLACAIPYTDHRKRLEFNKFGQIDPGSELIHSTVEIRFEVTMEI